jgi:hypothetical protein
MKKSKVIGYIVLCQYDTSGAYQLGTPGTDEEKSLWFGSYVTIFPTRDEAKKALKRTLKYRKENGYNWPWIDSSYVKEVRSA